MLEKHGEHQCCPAVHASRPPRRRGDQRERGGYGAENTSLFRHGHPSMARAMSSMAWVSPAAMCTLPAMEWVGRAISSSALSVGQLGRRHGCRAGGPSAHQLPPGCEGRRARSVGCRKRQSGLRVRASGRGFLRAHFPQLAEKGLGLAGRRMPISSAYTLNALSS